MCFYSDSTDVATNIRVKIMGSVRVIGVKIKGSVGAHPDPNPFQRTP